MPNSTEVDVSEIKTKVRSSTAREEILRELYSNEEKRPSELQNEICPRTGMSKGNIHAGLDVLQELELVERIEGSGRAVLYKLTEAGRDIAETLDLTGPPPEQDTTADREYDGPDFDAVDGLAEPDDGDNFELPTSSSDKQEQAEGKPETDDSIGQVPSLTDFENYGTVNKDRVEQLTRRLDQFLRHTNVSLPELVAAVENLTRSDESETSSGKNTTDN